MSQGVHDQIEAVTGILEFDQPVTAFSLMRRRNAEPLDIAQLTASHLRLPIVQYPVEIRIANAVVNRS